MVSTLSGQHIGLRGHDEVVPMKATDLVGPPGDRDTPPLGEEGGMVTLRLGESADLVREAQRRRPWSATYAESARRKCLLSRRPRCRPCSARALTVWISASR